MGEEDETAAADRGLGLRLQRELGEIRALQESLRQMVEDLKDRVGSTGERMQASQNYLYRELSQEIEEIREQLSLSTQAIVPCIEGGGRGEGGGEGGGKGGGEGGGKGGRVQKERNEAKNEEEKEGGREGETRVPVTGGEDTNYYDNE